LNCFESIFSGGVSFSCFFSFLKKVGLRVFPKGRYKTDALITVAVIKGDFGSGYVM
jgi:hypothetical protein